MRIRIYFFVNSNSIESTAIRLRKQSGLWNIKRTVFIYQRDRRATAFSCSLNALVVSEITWEDEGGGGGNNGTLGNFKDKLFEGLDKRKARGMRKSRSLLSQTTITTTTISIFLFLEAKAVKKIFSSVSSHSRVGVNFTSTYPLKSGSRCNDEGTHV